MSKLLEKLRKHTVVNADILKNSKYFSNEVFCPLQVPLMNVALTGSFKGGLPNGILMIAAPPKHFKTYFMIECIKAFQDKNKDKDHITIFYDSEKGSTPAYFESSGIDTSKVDHRPITSIEQLKVDIANLCEDISEGDSVLICLDSLGMLPSKKEVEDAINDKQVADMTRAKQIKSMFRIVTPHVVFKGFPMVVINHSYQSQDTHPVEVAGGGRGAQYAGHTLWFVSKAQEKDGEELVGSRFTIRSGLSRYVREKSAFAITVLFESGIEKYSGLFELALEMGLIKEATKGWYFYNGDETKKTRRAAIEEDEKYMISLLENKDFIKFVEDKYKI